MLGRHVASFPAYHVEFAKIETGALNLLGIVKAFREVESQIADRAQTLLEMSERVLSTKLEELAQTALPNTAALARPATNKPVELIVLFL